MTRKKLCDEDCNEEGIIPDNDNVFRGCTNHILEPIGATISILLFLLFLMIIVKFLFRVCLTWMKSCVTWQLICVTVQVPFPRQGSCTLFQTPPPLTPLAFLVPSHLIPKGGNATPPTLPRHKPLVSHPLHRSSLVFLMAPVESSLESCSTEGHTIVHVFCLS